MATSFQRPVPWWAASYPKVAKAIAGKVASATLVSCMHRTSGFAYPIHSSTRGSRAFSELTFHVAIRIGTPSCRIDGQYPARSSQTSLPLGGLGLRLGRRLGRSGLGLLRRLRLLRPCRGHLGLRRFGLRRLRCRLDGRGLGGGG